MQKDMHNYGVFMQIIRKFVKEQNAQVKKYSEANETKITISSTSQSTGYFVLPHLGSWSLLTQGTRLINQYIILHFFVHSLYSRVAKIWWWHSPWGSGYTATGIFHETTKTNTLNQLTRIILPNEMIGWFVEVPGNLLYHKKNIIDRLECGNLFSATSILL